MCDGDVLKLFSPVELEGLICGSKTLDFQALKRETRYDGYDEEDEVVQWFWDIALDLSDE